MMAEQQLCQCVHDGKPCGDIAIVEWEGKLLCRGCAERRNEALEMLNLLFGFKEQLIELPHEVMQLTLDKDEFLVIAGLMSAMVAVLADNIDVEASRQLALAAGNKLVNFSAPRYDELQDRMARLAKAAFGIEPDGTIRADITVIRDS
jgi:hypothetical protein